MVANAERTGHGNWSSLFLRNDQRMLNQMSIFNPSSIARGVNMHTL